MLEPIHSIHGQLGNVSREVKILRQNLKKKEIPEIIYIWHQHLSRWPNPEL